MVFHSPLARTFAAALVLLPALGAAQAPAASAPAPSALRMSQLYAARPGGLAVGDPAHSVSLFAASSRSRVERAAECFRQAAPRVATVLAADSGSVAWRLLAAAHVTAAEATTARQNLDGALDYARVATCLDGASAGGAVTALKAQTEILTTTPRMEPRPAPARFDAVGVVRRRSDAVARQAIVEGRYYTAPVELAAAIASYQGRFPDVHFVGIRHDGFYFVAVTGFVDAAAQAAARHAMRERGALELTALATFKPVKTVSITPYSTDLVSLQGAPLPYPPPTVATAEPAATEILEYEDLLEPLQSRVVRCYQGYTGQVNTGDGLLVDSPTRWVTGEQLPQCAGVVLNETTLTRCLLESDCPGLRLPLGLRYRAVDMVQRCLAGYGDATALPRDIACAATRLDPVYRAMTERYGITACFGTTASPSDACKQFLSLMDTLCAAPENKALCGGAPAIVHEWRERTALMVACMGPDRRQCAALVPRPPDASRRFAEEVDRLNRARAAAGQPRFDPSATLKVQVAGMGALGEPVPKFVGDFKACNDKRGKDDVAAATCFRDLALNATEQQVVSCVTQAGADPVQRARCIAPAGSKEAQALDRAQCASQAGGEPAKLVSCAGGDAAALVRATQDYECVTGSASALEVARKCVKGLTPQATQALNCAASPGLDAQGYARCLAGIDQNAAAAQCMWAAKNDQARLACVSGQLPLPSLPPAARQAIACSASGGDMAAIGSCVVAANLPPEIGKAVQCTGSSTGAVDFALCAADLGLNPELRIAAECASSTGGEPISFTACAGGRLTLRELQKCLSGEIGKEGGCFGPNNTLVKTLNDIGRDLREGPGATNDLVVAVGQVEQGLNKLGEEVSKGLQRIGEDAKRGDIGKAISRAFGF